MGKTVSGGGAVCSISAHLRGDDDAIRLCIAICQQSSIDLLQQIIRCLNWIKFNWTCHQFNTFIRSDLSGIRKPIIFKINSNNINVQFAHCIFYANHTRYIPPLLKG